MQLQPSLSAQDERTCVEVEETYWVGNWAGQTFQVRKIVAATYAKYPDDDVASRTVGKSWHVLVSSGHQLCVAPDGSLHEILTEQKLFRVPGPHLSP